jgi:NAD(P)H-hydrate epimerase
LSYPGAAALATAGACRIGAGLVTLATARGILGLTNRPPEVTLLPLREDGWGTIGADAVEDVQKSLADFQALLIGCGLGKEEPTRDFLRRLLDPQKPQKPVRVGFRAGMDEEDSSKEPGAVNLNLPPTVLDADALNILAEMENWPELLPRERFVLTPHPGEMKRLLKVEHLDDDPVKVATSAARHWGQVVVLKAASTVIATPDGHSTMHTDGNPALATAGTGDVLAGCIVGLIAQGMKPADAAVLGVYLHSAAGTRVREELGSAGTLASDLLPHLPRVLKELKVKK